jgi:hypothetical protein
MLEAFCAKVTSVKLYRPAGITQIRCSPGPCTSFPVTTAAPSPCNPPPANHIPQSFVLFASSESPTEYRTTLPMAWQTPPPNVSPNRGLSDTPPAATPVSQISEASVRTLPSSSPAPAISQTPAAKELPM